MNILPHLLRRSWAYPLALLLLGIGTYAIMASQLGFYWDDWPAVYLSRVGNNQVLWEYFAYDRPISAWTYIVTFPILGAHPLVWQICTLLLRWVSVLCLTSVLAAIWPQRVWEVRWMGAVLFVFPIFSLQSISVAFNQHFLTYAVFAASLLFMVWAVKRPRLFWLWMPLSIFAQWLHLFTMEYFAGLELLRPMVLWFLLRQPQDRLFRTTSKVLVRWLPFLVGLVFFAYWRFAYYPFQFSGEVRNDPTLFKQILASPMTGLRMLAENVTRDSYYLLSGGWMTAMQSLTGKLEEKSMLFSLFVGLGLATLYATVVEFGRESPKSQEALDKFTVQGVLLGLVALVLGGLPVWLIGRQITVGKWSDRFALAPMLGAAILTVVLADWLVQTHKRKVLMILLVGLASAVQIYTVNKYRLDWFYQRDYFWQLSWRVPALPPGTAVFSAFIATDKLSEYSIGFALNTLYSQDPLSDQALYWFFTPRRLGEAFEKLAPGYLIHYRLRNIQFDGSTSQAVAVAYRSGKTCLRLLEPTYSLDPKLESDEVALIPLSNLGQITQQGAFSPPSDIFGREPDHTWCFYYQKADLARQQGDWNTVLTYMETARQKGFVPQDGAELLPLIEAYAQTGQWQAALEVSQHAQNLTAKLEPFLCTHWQRFATLLENPEKAVVLQQVQVRFGCNSIELNR